MTKFKQQSSQKKKKKEKRVSEKLLTVSKKTMLIIGPNKLAPKFCCKIIVKLLSP